MNPWINQCAVLMAAAGALAFSTEVAAAEKVQKITFIEDDDYIGRTFRDRLFKETLKDELKIKAKIISSLQGIKKTFIVDKETTNTKTCTTTNFFNSCPCFFSPCSIFSLRGRNTCVCRKFIDSYIFFVIYNY